jgi:hypothetical protein
MKKGYRRTEKKVTVWKRMAINAQKKDKRQEIKSKLELSEVLSNGGGTTLC